MSDNGPRSAALAAVMDVVQRGRFLDQALDTALARLPPGRDRAFARELAYGVCRYWVRLAAIRDRFLARPLKARDADVGAVIAIGLYQLEHSRVPAHAAVAETVALTGGLRKNWARGVVNAVLRRFVREREDCLASLAGNPEAVHSHPRWMLRALQDAWPEHWLDIVAANNTQAQMTLRVNRRVLDRDHAMQQLSDAGVGTYPCRYSADGLHLDQPRDVSGIPGFSAGSFSVQDEAAQLACDLLAPGPDDRVLDACAAPGGKIAHLLERHRSLPAAVAVEREAARVDRLRQTLDRLHLEARVVHGDVTQPEQWWDGNTFQRILLDAPCSASGVIRRHPDIKLHRRREDLALLAAQQLRLIEALWPLLARDGRLLYATCSVLPEENSAPVARFLSAHDDAVTIDLQVPWGSPLPPGRQILPGEAGMDGFYYALLRKR